VAWILDHLWSALAGLAYVLTHPGAAFDLADPEAVMRIVHYGASPELLILFLLTSGAVFAIGAIRRPFLWRVVRVLEGVANGVGRIAAWAGLLMVLQQVMVIFLQSVFRVTEISVGAGGFGLTRSLGWYSDGLKLHNAVIVCLCCAYAFVQGGHVRVDLFYAGARFRVKRLIDMAGALVFMIPTLLLIWYYAWFFLWRHLINPKVAASDTLERLMQKSRAFQWSVETIGVSPDGFSAYFLFKLLLVAFCLTMLLQALAVFYRAYLECVEGEASAGRHLDRDAPAGDDAPAAPSMGR